MKAGIENNQGKGKHSRQKQPEAGDRPPDKDGLNSSNLPTQNDNRRCDESTAAAQYCSFPRVTAYDLCQKALSAFVGIHADSTAVDHVKRFAAAPGHAGERIFSNNNGQAGFFAQ